MDFLMFAIVLYGAILLALFGGLLLPSYVIAYYIRHSRPASALPLARYLYTIARVLKTWRGVSAHYLAACYAGLGDFVEVRHYAEESLLYFDSRPNYIKRSKRWMSFSFCSKAYLGLSLARLGEYDRAAELFDEVLATDKLPANLRPNVELYAAGVYIAHGRFADAKRLVDNLLRTVKPGSEQLWLATLQGANLEFFSDRFSEALAIVEPLLSQQSTIPWFSMSVLGLAIRCLIPLNRLEDAKVLEEKSPATTSPPNIVAGFLTARAELALAQGNLDRARDLAQQAQQVDATPSSQAYAQLIQAQVFLARENRNMALQLCTEIQHSKAMQYYRDKAKLLEQRITGVTPQIEEEAAPLSYQPAPALPEAIQRIIRTSPMD